LFYRFISSHVFFWFVVCLSVFEKPVKPRFGEMQPLQQTFENRRFLCPSQRLTVWRMRVT
jgi:p-aminobenzoyl-glutamate transporter AbgT